MKKSFIKYIQALMFLSILAMSGIITSCEKENTDPPSILYLRNYAASPADSIVKTVSAGQWVVLVGKNLSQITQVYFGSIQATVNSALYKDTCVVIQVPSIPFLQVSGDKLNEVTVVNEHGTTTFKINIIGEPIIKYIRNYAPAPNDNIVKEIGVGQKINIVGVNLKNATKISFQGVNADLSKVIFTDTSAVVEVPADLTGGNAALVNTVNYTNKVGTGSFFIKIIGPPIVTSVSYELPNEGDSVYVYGNNFIAVKKLSFAGTEISSFEVKSDSVIGFKAPALSGDGGPVVIEAIGGIFTTSLKVNDINHINTGGVGILGNLEWGDYFGYVWWGGAELASNNADFGAGHGQYMVLKTNILNSGAGDEWGNAIRIKNNKGGEWLPEANVNDPATDWALKFEMNVAKPWNGATLCIKSGNGDVMYRFEPWQIKPSTTAAYSKKGWQTVTIPLSAFRKKDTVLGDGKGAQISKPFDMLDPTGKSDLIVFVHNFGASPTETDFYAAFDNFRVVKR
jgi:hypothetical protein